MEPLIIRLSSEVWLRLNPVAVGERAPRGHYLATEVGQLAGVSGKKIGQWARRGYIKSSWHETVPRLYSYEDVAEAMVVHELENRNVPPKVVGQVVRRLRDRLGINWPLQVADLYVPRHDADSLAKSRTVADWDGTVFHDLVKDHPMLAQMDLVEIAKDLARGGWAARDLPDLRYIEVNPNRLSGRPAIRGRRVSAKDVANIAS